MKKLYSLLVVLFAIVTMQANAQLSCNAAFTTQFLNGSTVKFNSSPLVSDSPNVYHFWSYTEVGGGYFSYSYAVSPTNIFPTGVFSIGHRVYRFNPNGGVLCTDSTNQIITVAQGACLISSYIYSYPSQTNPLQRNYYCSINNSSPTDSIRWTFGDGTSSNALYPIHTFANYGIYNVCLRVIKRNANGTLSNCISETCKLDTIAPAPCNLQADFTWYRDSLITVPNSYHFTNSTVPLSNTDSIRWTFGDGTSSNQVNPVHAYTTTGTFTVCLRVIKRNPNGTLTNCISEKCHQVNVNVPTPPCTLVANYTWYRDSLPTVALYTYHFTNTSSPLAATDSIRWSFGDGTFSNQVNPNHTYAQPGTYTVCLRIIKRNANGTLTNCIKEKCYSIVIAPFVNPCTLVANYTWYRDSLPTVALYTYHFTNTSSPLAATDSIRWSFGDGTFSNQVNPNHTYAQPGTYTVCLRIIKRNANGTLTTCVKEKCYTIVIAPFVNPCNLQVYFTSVVNTFSTDTIYFTNQSTGFASGDSIIWNFGDGTFSNSFSPSHGFSTSGTYIVCLKIKKNNNIAGTVPCIREFCKTIVVSIPTPCTLVTNFTWYRDSLPNVAANTIHFINTSTPVASADSIRWTFGDGKTSNQLNPVHVYTQTGTYNVCLRIIKRVNGVLTNCIKEKCYTIIVAQVCNIAANYTWRVDSTNYKNIIFTNTTSTPNTVVTALWTFGDGTSATSWNATHLYAQPGRYYVCLRIQNGNCISYKCDSVTITVPVPTCTQLSSYTFIRTNNTVTFAPTFVATGVQYTWAFGDGTGAQGANATHTYTTAGTYTACLTAYKNNNCASTTCNTIQILPTINCNNITLSITDVRDSLVPNRIKFTAVSNTTSTSQQWTITKIPSTATQVPVVINSNNPTYMFLDSGYYNVCVRVTYANGCIKNVCKTIYINQNMPSTNVCILQVYPNPATSVVNAAVTLLQPQLINARVYNTSNIQVAQSQQQGVVGLNTVSVNVANLPAGIYTLRVLYGGQACYAAFIKQ